MVPDFLFAGWKLRPSWMTAALHTPQDSGVQRNSTLQVGAPYKSRTPNAPARLPFLLLLFFWVSKRKEGSRD
ncbi:MAG: hypothetical protein IJG80_10360, partial [Selenomonadaceae bacterium]|nr:hypothetical protein [Selenomonadaceae bacterium]